MIRQSRTLARLKIWTSSSPDNRHLAPLMRRRVSMTLAISIFLSIRVQISKASKGVSSGCVCSSHPATDAHPVRPIIRSLSIYGHFTDAKDYHDLSGPCGCLVSVPTGVDHLVTMTVCVRRNPSCTRCSLQMFNINTNVIGDVVTS